MKLKITYPQIYMESKEIEIDDEKAEDVLNEGMYGQADFIWQNLTEFEQQCTYGLSQLQSAIDAGYSHIKKASNE